MTALHLKSAASLDAALLVDIFTSKDGEYITLDAKLWMISSI